MIIPDIAKLHFRNITKALAGYQSQQHSVTHIPMVGVCNLEYPLPFLQTEALAKLANRAAKEWPQTGGVVDLSNQARQRRLMALMPVEEVWGVGRRIARKLEAMSIKNALQLCDTDIRFIRKHFNVVLERTVRELRGEPCLEIEELAPAKQEIVCSRSFGERITDYEAMRQAICSYAARGGKAPRRASVLPVHFGVRENVAVLC